MAVEALRSAGYNVIAHDQLFTQDTADEVWLAEAGRQGWIVITADRRIRYRRDERDIFKAHGVRAVFLTSGNMTGPQTAGLLVRCAAKMQEVVGAATPPAAFTLTKDGHLSPLALGGSSPAEVIAKDG